MRKPLIAGNWKMNGSRGQNKKLIDGIKADASELTDVEVLVLPTYVHLFEVSEWLSDSSVMLGAQDLYVGESGAFTGQISGAMLRDVGCDYVLVGHSERRSLFHDDLASVSEKFKSAVAAQLKPILCVGETREEREAGQTESVIRAQLEAVVKAAGVDAFKQAVIAYEPVWAIGTGLTATPEQAQAVHAFIRELIAQNNVDLAGAIRILYGGSMKPDNARALLAMPDIDGGLIGGAALDAGSFLAICKAAEVKVGV